jgi:hypothetical protein
MAQQIEVPNFGVVEFPDDMTDAQITTAIKKNSLSYKAPTRAEKVTKGMRDPIDAGAQLLTNILPEPVVNAGNQLNNFIADKTGLLGRLPEGGVNQQITEQEQAYQAQRQAGGEEGFDGYRLLGNIASPANLAIASRLPVAPSLAKSAAAGAGINVLSQPVVGVGEGANFAEEKGKQALVGGIAGPVGDKIARGVSRIISPNASTNPALQTLRSEGVNPTIGQTLGGRFSQLEQKLASYPLVGDLIGKARGNANIQFERAAYNRALKPLGQTLPEGLSGRQALEFTETTLRDNYDNVLNSIGAVVPDKQFNSKVSSLSNLVNGMKVPADKKMEYQAVLDTLDSVKDANGVITSQGFKDLESELGKIASNLGGSKNIFDNRVGPAVKQVQQELRDMLQRQAGPLAKELQKTNQAYSQFKRIQRAASSVGAVDGNFTPSQLQSAVKALDRSKDKGAFARGSAQMQDLSDAGRSVLGDSLPNSGTADRLLLGGSGLAAMMEPNIGVPLLAGASLYTQPGQSLLNNLVTRRPGFAAPTAEFIRNNSNYILPGSGAVGMGLLNQ